VNYKCKSLTIIYIEHNLDMNIQDVQIMTMGHTWATKVIQVQLRKFGYKISKILSS